MISSDIHQPSITQINFKIIYLKFRSNLRGRWVHQQPEMLFCLWYLWAKWLWLSETSVFRVVAPVSVQEGGRLGRRLANVWPRLGWERQLWSNWWEWRLSRRRGKRWKVGQDLTHKQLSHLYILKKTYFLMLLTINVMFLFETCPTQCIFSQHCGYWWPGALVACVSVYVCLCVNHELICMITSDPFKLESPNLDQKCKIPWVKIPIVLWGDWFWPTGSNLTSK